MVSLFKPSFINRLLLCGVLTTFTVAVITPSPAYAITFNDIAFWTRMEKLVEKMWKYKDKKDGNKIIDTMLEIKMEVEAYTGILIDLDKEFSKARSDIKKQGGKVPEKDFEKIRKAINKKEKILYHRNMCVATYLEDAPNISFQDFETLYMAARNAHDREEGEQEVKDLPWRLAVGISMILGGGFLVVAGTLLRMPICVEAGKDLAAGGVFFAVEGYHDGQEEKKDKNNK
jgi:hypothetical protein